MFQSSPTSKGGRYAKHPSWQRRATCFNPRPPRKVGATAFFPHIRNPNVVSILAHLERWALQLKINKKPRGPGVSILAHLERWALHCRPVGNSIAQVLQPVSILAHLERWALRCRSAPGQQIEMNVSILAHLERWALRLTRRRGYECTTVSILAHLERWALRGFQGNGLRVAVFQSSPTSKGGRYPRRGIVTAGRHCFNPRPPRKVGATGKLG